MQVSTKTYSPQEYADKKNKITFDSFKFEISLDELYDRIEF